MNALTLCLLSIFTSLSALSDTANVMKSSPQFPYKTLKAAFAKARKPTTEELSGKKWMLIGIVSAPDWIDHSNDGYWPDGRNPKSGRAGYVRRLNTFASISDVFGKPLGLALTVKWIDLATGKSHKKHGPFVGKFTSTGFQIFFEGDETTCGRTIEYRIARTDEKSMLLGATSTADKDPTGRFRMQLGSILSNDEVELRTSVASQGRVLGCHVERHGPGRSSDSPQSPPARHHPSAQTAEAGVNGGTAFFRSASAAA